MPIESDAPYRDPLFAVITPDQRRRFGLPASLMGVYATITAALTDLDTSGIAGPVRYLLTDSVYPSETIPISVSVSVDPKPGPSATITIKPFGGASPTIPGALQVGTDYVTIEGSNTEGGTTRDLTILGPVALSIWGLSNQPEDTIRHVTIEHTRIIDSSSVGSALSIGPAFDNDLGPHADITIDNNEIFGGSIGIRAVGWGEVSQGRNLAITGNDIHGFREMGIILKYTDTILVARNTVRDNEGAPGNYLEGIRSEIGATHVVIERNTVRDIAAPPTSWPWYGGMGIVVVGFDPDVRVTVRNNMIHGISGPGNPYVKTSNPAGILVRSPGGAGIGVYGNSILLSGDHLAQENALSIGIGVGYGGRPDVRNNIIVNNLGLAGSVGVGSCGVFLEDTASLPAVFDYNLIDVDPAGPGVKAIGVIDTAIYATLPEWNSATGFEAHGVVGDPLFAGPNDLHITDPGSPAGNAGFPVAGLAEDFDGDVRSIGSPDIGADEFPPVPAGIFVNMDADWNLVSVPVIAADWRASVLFPPPASRVYAYEGGYIERDTLDPGRGYWVRFPDPTTAEYQGTLIATDTVEVGARWNIIGATGLPIATAQIASIPPGMVTSPFYDYSSGGYSVADTLHPGHGYWVKTAEAGKLVLAPGTQQPASYRIRIGLSTGPPPPPSEDNGLIGQGGVPQAFVLEQNYPNPFNPATTIGFQVPEAGWVTIRIYDILGREVATLLEGHWEVGRYKVTFEAGELPSGVYVYRMAAGAFSELKKFMVIR